jgi:hypothetical protein
MRSAREKLSEGSSPGGQRVTLQRAEASSLQPLLTLQQTVGNQAVLRLLAGSRLQTKLKVSHPSDAHEQEADWIATRIVGGASGPLVQRKCAACAAGAPCSECADQEMLQPQLKSRGVTGGGAIVQRSPAAGAEATPAASSAAQAEASPAPASPAPASAAPALIVEDDAQKVGPGQMRKSEFLSQLRSAVCSAADDALSGTMWSAMGCPYIERWLDHYSKQPGPYVERALRKYAPETASARSASEYIPIVTQRVRRGIAEWTSTGEVKGLPEEFAAGGMPGATVSGLVGGLLSGVGSAISGLVSGAGKALSSVGSMLFKRHDGEAGVEGDPHLIQSQLRSGQALDSSVRGRMQSAFGVDFNGVRVHTDTRARELSEGLNARAFTIGSDIAFGPGEYQPGTPVGDALIAHELAHVVQQGGRSSDASPRSKSEAGHDALEEEADTSAMGAVVRIWDGPGGPLANLKKNATPQLRSGLKLQRCGSPSPAEPAKSPGTSTQTPDGAKPPVSVPEKPPPTVAEQIPHSLDRSFSEKGLAEDNVNKALQYFGRTNVAINLVNWFQAENNPSGGAVGPFTVTVIFVADPTDMPGVEEKAARGTYKKVGPKKYNVYVTAGERAQFRDGTYGPIQKRRAESMADTIFHELLHVWFENRFSGEGTGHTKNVKETEIGARGTKKYDKSEYDQRFLEKLESFDAEVREVIDKDK